MRTAIRLAAGILGGGAKSWDPSQAIGGTLPTIWLKNNTGLFQAANGTQPVTADADPVGQWQDQSANANHVQYFSNVNRRPAYKTGILNSHPGLLFNGSTTRLDTSGATLFSAKCTLFVVYSGYASGSLVGTANSGTSALTRNATFFPSVADSGDFSINPVLTGRNLLTASLNYTGKVFSARVDGVAAGSKSGAGGTVPTGAFDIGQGFSEFLSGYLYEFLMYPDTLSVANIAIVESYLTKKLITT
jgi:hypothetical protein